MPKTDKRHTQVDLQSIRNPYGRSSQEENKQGILNKLADETVTLNTGSGLRPGGEGSAVPVIQHPRPQLLRQARFPVKAYGGMKSESPWSTYEQIYVLRLGSGFYVTVSERIDSPFEQVSIRDFPGPLNKDQLQMLQQIRHDSFVTALDTFRFQDTTYVVFENMPVSLYEISLSILRVDTIHLAAILGQVVEGLMHLSEKHLEHGALTCSNILVSWEGAVKIACYEHCHYRTTENTDNPDVRALECITADLMGGHVKENGVISLADPGSWDTVALNFLAATTSVTSVHELTKHPLLMLPWKKEDLKRLVLVAIYSVRFDLTL